MNITEVGFIVLCVWLSKVLHRVDRRYPLKLIDDLVLLLFTNVISSNQRIIPDCSKSHVERQRCNEASRISFVMITRTFQKLRVDTLPLMPYHPSDCVGAGKYL